MRGLLLYVDILSKEMYDCSNPLLVRGVVGGSFHIFIP